MIFDRSYSHEFEWRGKQLRIGFLHPEARIKIADGFNYMSRETVRHRFFGTKNGFSDRELRHLTEIDGVDHFALGVEEVHKPERGIAVIRMFRDEALKNEAEIAVLIIDDYQKQGLGTLLMGLCLIAAQERAIDTLRFSFLPDNQGIRRLIRSFGATIPETVGPDIVQQRMHLGPSRAEELKREYSAFLPQK